MRRLANGTIELVITVAWDRIQAAYDQVVEAAVKNSEINGFRKGHAPRQLIESRLDRNQTFSRALQHLLPKIYQEAVDKHGLKPIVYPTIQIKKGQEGEEWVFVALLCEAPQVKLGPIRKKKGQKLVEIIDSLVARSQVVVPDLLVEQEVNRRLSQLAENLTRLGLTVDKYLASKKLTSKDLQVKLATEARHDLSVEFVLRQVEVEKQLANRQQTLDFLTARI